MAPYVPKIRSTYTATSHSTLDGLRQRECLAYIQTSVLSAAPLPAFSPKPPPSFLLPPASVLPVIPIPSFGMILSLCGRCPTSLGVTECGSFCGVHRGPETAVRGHFLPTDAIDAPIGRADFAHGQTSLPRSSGPPRPTSELAPDQSATGVFRLRLRCTGAGR